MQHTPTRRRYLVPTWALALIAIVAFLALVFGPLPAAHAEEAPPADPAPIVVDEPEATEPVVEESLLQAPATVPPAFVPYAVSARWLLPATWDYATTPTYQAAIFPQAVLVGDPPACRWSQDDQYWIENEAEAALFASLDDDGVLTQGEDSAIYASHVFTLGPACPPAEPPVTNQACPTTGSVVTTDLATWDLSQSRSQSTTVLTAAGLQLDTFGAAGSPDQRKAAGYYATDFALANTGALSLTWTGTTPAPGGQLAVDLDNNGTIDGYLVFESVYAANLWASSGIQSGGFVGLPTHGGGGGPISGTIDEYLAAYPDARVKAIGYSLGSGVTGSGVISSIVAGCIEYTFGLPAVVVPPVVPPATTALPPALALTGANDALLGGLGLGGSLLLLLGALAVAWPHRAGIRRVALALSHRG